MLDLEVIFDKYEDEHLKFESIQNPLHPRPDICAFLLLHNLVPSGKDIVSAAGHDEIWLDVSPESVAQVATEEDILTLIRCGVMLSDDESFSMFV